MSRNSPVKVLEGLGEKRVFGKALHSDGTLGV